MGEAGLWVGCGECDPEFACYNGAVRCIRLAASKKTASILAGALDKATAAPAEAAEPVAVVRSVVGSGAEAVRIKWLGGFPQIGDRLYAAPVFAPPEARDICTQHKWNCQLNPCPQCPGQ